MRHNQFEDAVNECERKNMPVMFWPEDKGKVTWPMLPFVEINAELTEKWDLVTVLPIGCGQAGTIIKEVQAGKAGATFKTVDDRHVIGLFTPRERCGAPACGCERNAKLISELADDVLDADKKAAYWEDEAERLADELTDEIEDGEKMAAELVDLRKLEAQRDAVDVALNGLLNVVKLQAEELADERENSNQMRDAFQARDKSVRLAARIIADLEILAGARLVTG
jgi:hypothetical protein